MKIVVLVPFVGFEPTTTSLFPIYSISNYCRNKNVKNNDYTKRNKNKQKNAQTKKTLQ